MPRATGRPSNAPTASGPGRAARPSPARPTAGSASRAAGRRLLRTRLAELTLRDESNLRRRLDRASAGRPDPAAEVRLTADLEAAEARVARRRAAVPKLTYPPQLPVTGRRDDLLAAISANQVVIVAGETGSGKTTQLPKLCLELGRGVRGAIAHTQPRRLAARAAAERIAEELGVELGGAIGYAVRFSDRSGDETLVRLVTDGLLLAEIQRDRLLLRYDTIIVDEAHERSLNIDFLLGYLGRLLDRRTDLKLIIASATIDADRFSRHFGGAPVIEVSGRTYPVEVRYRPLGPQDPDEDDEESGPSDPIEAIGDAVDELLRDGPGDVLVFLSGEREIRDTAEALAGRLGQAVEVLPLYARLSHAEQRRVFAPHRGRRVVLSTNVAETSLTVPGIGSVVDPGTARISRFSGRLKVQRLPIERISKASADQRKGRCGRTSDGICIRLYSDADFADRPDFTDPEILRTSLASVLLQMASLGLGEVEDFGFIDPPDRRQVRDGINLLEELGAFDPNARDPAKRLTPLGRRLAQLPVDPRLGRMVLEADRLACAEEVIVIAAALSIQEVRERPADRRAAADEQHARFAADGSDFVSYLNLWNHLRDQRDALSGSQFRKRCRAEFLHYLRVREWQDLVAQIRQAARSAGVTLNQAPADPQHVHLALLSGLLSQIGVRNVARREYDGARGARFAIFPGSVLARRAPSWVMVAELVETSRLWGRTAAAIQPAWVEPIAGDLLKRTYDDPHWEKRRGSVVATERATLYGLPIVAGRKVAYHRIEPVLSRDQFIRRALIDGDWDGRHEFLTHNAELVAAVEELEHRVRRRDILVSDEALFDFYDARVPADVVSAAHFDRWWSRRRGPARHMLDFTRELLVGPALGDALDPAARPDAWRQGDVVLPLTYRFEPGDEHDGVSVDVPLAGLAGLRPDGFDWLVPALREELVTALIRSLPKELRRPLVPVPALAAEIVANLKPRHGRLVDAVAAELDRLRGVRVDPDAWDLDRLPPHLRMTFRAVDDAGAPIATDTDLDRLRDGLAPRLRAALAEATVGLERHGMRTAAFGVLPRTVALPGSGDAVRAYPALVDEGDGVGVLAFETADAQAGAMRAGTRRLLALTISSPARAAERSLTGPQTLTLAGAPHGSLAGVLDDVVGAAIDGLVGAAGGPAWSDADFAILRDRVAAGLVASTTDLLRLVVAILEARTAVRRRLDALSADPSLQPARLDVATQLGSLVYAGFATATGAARLPDVRRYLEAAVRRLDRLPDGRPQDTDRMRVIGELEAELRVRVAAVAAGRPVPPGLADVGWMIQELRVSSFAQGLGVLGQVSAKRIRRALAAA
ncbi:MAG TPA: ATP-dependent RNA helicase HrpA [Solirubrobacteraceae bacterium]|nr:ATP-dependent RNA helicase HrpA [Solirubrobacteraceae bacterium]